MNIVSGFEKGIIDQHEQKYCNSCVPSAVEMVLKLLEQVDVDYYCLQDHWCDMKINFREHLRDHHCDLRNNNEICDFEIFDNIRLKGVTFHRECRCPEELFRKIDEELDADRYVIISLPPGYHAWVIYGRKGSDYLSISKHGRTTIDCDNVKEIVLGKWKVKHGQTDILVYGET